MAIRITSLLVYEYLATHIRHFKRKNQRIITIDEHFFATLQFSRTPSIFEDVDVYSKTYTGYGTISRGDISVSDTSKAQTLGQLGLDMFDPQSIAQPHQFYAKLRAEHPIIWSDQTQSWVLSRYDDVRHVLRHPELFSSAHLSDGQAIIGRTEVLYETALFLERAGHIISCIITGIR